MEDIPIKVALRIRPLMSKEKTDCVRKISGENQVIVGNDKCFSFDHVFEQLSSQIEIFNTAVLPLLTHFYKGNNATVLAYGQTGSGKTYTMGSSYISLLQELNNSHTPSKITKNNDSDSLGVIPRVFKNLFRHIDELKGANSDAVFSVSCSFVEIYNEEIKDLFTEKKKRISAEHLSVSADEKISLTINSYAEAIGLLKNASSLRAVGSTLVNEESSRSHAILTINLEQRLPENQTLKSKLQLVDLAGSERQSKTKAEGIRLKEGININKGLLALGNVISVLSTNNAENKPRHVPYRDSKLTRLLKDSLGGDSHTIMIACVSPSDQTVKESLNTLQYADRARKIKNKPKLQKFIISSNKLNEINGSQIEKINEESIYNSSIKHLEIQLKVKENVIIEQSNQINELKTEIEQLKKTLVPKLNDLINNREKLVYTAMDILKNFGIELNITKSVDNNEEILPNALSVNGIPIHLKKNLEAMKKNDKQSSAIYRALLSWMLQTIDDKELGNCNYDILQNKYNSIINYCKDMMIKIDSTFPNRKNEFSEEVNGKVLRELCCEARQRVWKTEPNHVFSLNGKQLKKQTKNITAGSKDTRL